MNSDRNDETDAGPVDDVPAKDDEFHRIVSNGLHIFGKAAQWTPEEIRKFSLWLKGRISL